MTNINILGVNVPLTIEFFRAFLSSVKTICQTSTFIPSNTGFWDELADVANRVWPIGLTGNICKMVFDWIYEYSKQPEEMRAVYEALSGVKPLINKLMREHGYLFEVEAGPSTRTVGQVSNLSGPSTHTVAQVSNPSGPSTHQMTSLEDPELDAKTYMLFNQMVKDGFLDGWEMRAFERYIQNSKYAQAVFVDLPTMKAKCAYVRASLKEDILQLRQLERRVRR